MKVLQKRKLKTVSLFFFFFFFYISTTLYIFLSMSILYLLGVNHLIIFETNRTTSRIYSTFACRFVHPSSPLPLFASSRSTSFRPAENVFFSSCRVCPTKKEEKPGCEPSTSSDRMQKSCILPQDHGVLAENCKSKISIFQLKETGKGIYFIIFFVDKTKKRAFRSTDITFIWITFFG